MGTFHEKIFVLDDPPGSRVKDAFTSKGVRMVVEVEMGKDWRKKTFQKDNLGQN